MDKDTFKFLRKYYNLPAELSLSWCIIKETNQNNEVEIRIGAKIGNSKTAIDVFTRKFVSEIDLAECKREFIPVRRHLKDNEVEFWVDGGCSLALPRNFMSDVYTSSWYDEETLKRVWL